MKMANTTGQILGKSHRLCEWLRSNNRKLIGGLQPAPIALTIEKASKWHVGHAADLPKPKYRDTLEATPLRLPVNVMLIEYENALRFTDGRILESTGFLLCANDPEGGIEFFSFQHCDHRFFFDGGGYIGEQECHRLFAPFKDFVEQGLELSRCSYILELTLLAIHCNNVISVDNVPPAALNKKRQKSGKLPLFTYKTLHVMDRKINSQHSCKTCNDEARRAPRLHFRRGHVRRIAEGRITWVQQCMVGNSRLGIVEKCYSLDARR